MWYSPVQMCSRLSLCVCCKAREEQEALRLEMEGMHRISEVQSVYVVLCLRTCLVLALNIKSLVLVDLRVISCSMLRSTHQNLKVIRLNGRCAFWTLLHLPWTHFQTVNIRRSSSFQALTEDVPTQLDCIWCILETFLLFSSSQMHILQQADNSSKIIFEIKNEVVN